MFEEKKYNEKMNKTFEKFLNQKLMVLEQLDYQLNF